MAEMDKSEQALFEMLNHLWNLNQEGKGDTRGITKLSEDFGIALHARVWKILDKLKIIIKNRQEDGKTMIISYLANDRPQPQLAKEVMEEARAQGRKQKKDWQENQKKTGIASVDKVADALKIEYVESEGDKLVKEDEPPFWQKQFDEYQSRITVLEQINADLTKRVEQSQEYGRRMYTGWTEEEIVVKKLRKKNKLLRKLLKQLL